MIRKRFNEKYINRRINEQYSRLYEECQITDCLEYVFNNTGVYRTSFKNDTFYVYDIKRDQYYASIGPISKISNPKKAKTSEISKLITLYNVKISKYSKETSEDIINKINETVKSLATKIKMAFNKIM